MVDLWKDRLKVGQKVRFSPTHNKEITFTGTIIAIHEGVTDCVDIKSDPDNGSVGRLYTAGAADVRVTADGAEKQDKKQGSKKQEGNGAKKDEAKKNGTEDGTAENAGTE